MKLGSLNWQMIIQIVFVVSFSETYFDVQYIGNFVPLDMATTRNFCEKVPCLSDMSLMFEAASQNFKIDPCEDFKEFTLGRFIKYRVVNERYKFRGLQGDVEARHKEKMRRVLIEKINYEKDPRVFKVIKSFFKKCVNQTHIHIEGTREMVNYLNSLGSSQFLMRDTPHLWNYSGFNISKYFTSEPDHAVWVFFDHKIARCHHPKIFGKDIPCLKLHVGWTITRTNNKDLTEMLLDMNDSFMIGKIKKRELLAQIEKAIYYKSSYYRAKKTYQKFINTTKSIMKIKEIQKFTHMLEINWLKIINDMFFADSQWTDEDEIMVDDIELIKNLANVISQTSAEILAETFVLTFLYSHQWFYNSYPFDELFAKNRGTKKAYQRWESCLFDINYKLSPALELMYSRKNKNITFNIGARSLIEEAVDECVRLVDVKTNFTQVMKVELSKRLKSMTILTGFDEQVLNTKDDLEKMYSELTLYGNESYFDLWHETLRFIKKLENQYESDFKFQINKIANLYITDIIYDKLYIPSKWLLYPWFHPFRAKFFNVATIFTKIVEAVLDYARRTAFETWHIHDEFLNTADADEIAYEWYEKWLDDGNTDLKYGANRLTDKQLYWFALARKFYVKVHDNLPQDVDPIGQLQSEYMHFLYKSKPGFQRAYNCTLNEFETKMYEEYQKKLKNLYLNYS